jgi:hypothetical protein
MERGEWPIRDIGHAQGGGSGTSGMPVAAEHPAPTLHGIEARKEGTGEIDDFFFLMRHEVRFEVDNN